MVYRLIYSSITIPTHCQGWTGGRWATSLASLPLTYHLELENILFPQAHYSPGELRSPKVTASVETPGSLGHGENRPTQSVSATEPRTVRTGEPMLWLVGLQGRYSKQVPPSRLEQGEALPG